MTIKDILVHLDGGKRTAVRANIAAGLAKKFGARLVGQFAQAKHHLRIVSEDKSSPEAEAAKAKAWFNEAVTAAGVTGEFREITAARESDVVNQMIQAALHTDLVVLGQMDADTTGSGIPGDLAEQVILHSGRPALVIPYVGSFDAIGTRPIVAWNGGRESARALHDALPLISDAKKVDIVVVRHAASEDKAPNSDHLIDHLATHGLAAETRKYVSVEARTMDIILSAAADEASDLLIMGAHGNYGFPFLHRGGGTQHILAHMTLPVLMSN